MSVMNKNIANALALLFFFLLFFACGILRNIYVLEKPVGYAVYSSLGSLFLLLCYLFWELITDKNPD